MSNKQPVERRIFLMGALALPAALYSERVLGFVPPKTKSPLARELSDLRVHIARELNVSKPTQSRSGRTPRRIYRNRAKETLSPKVSSASFQDKGKTVVTAVPENSIWTQNVLPKRQPVAGESIGGTQQSKPTALEIKAAALEHLRSASVIVKPSVPDTVFVNTRVTSRDVSIAVGGNTQVTENTAYYFLNQGVLAADGLFSGGEIGKGYGVLQASTNHPEDSESAQLYKNLLDKLTADVSQARRNLVVVEDLSHISFTTDYDDQIVLFNLATIRDANRLFSADRLKSLLREQVVQDMETFGFFAPCGMIVPEGIYHYMIYDPETGILHPGEPLNVLPHMSIEVNIQIGAGYAHITHIKM